VAKHIAVLPCDGAGKEVVPEAIKVLTAAGAKFEYEEFDINADAYLRTKVAIPAEVWSQLERADAILFGSVGDPRVPDAEYLAGVLLRLRFELDLYINLRPFWAPPRVDFTVIRENTEGTYAGEGGFLRKGTPHEVATQGSVNTRRGVERCIRYAFDLARNRTRKHLTLVHKTNVLTFAGDLWQRTFDAVAADQVATRSASWVSRRHAAASAITRSKDSAAPFPSPFSKSPSTHPSWLDTWARQITGRAQATAKA